MYVWVQMLQILSNKVWKSKKSIVIGLGNLSGPNFKVATSAAKTSGHQLHQLQLCKGRPSHLASYNHSYLSLLCVWPILSVYQECFGWWQWVCTFCWKAGVCGKFQRYCRTFFLAKLTGITNFRAFRIRMVEGNHEISVKKLHGWEGAMV